MGDTIANLIYLSILLVVIATVFFASNRPSLGKTVQMLLVWGMIFMGLIAGYGLWDQIAGSFHSNTTQTIAEDTVQVPRRSDGHFYLTVRVNDTPIEFLVDTGASDLVLTKQDARAVGIDVDNLAFLGRAFTANGEVATARTRLDSVEIGNFRDTRVLASVNGGEMSSSLLGMSYLGRYDRIEITNDRMVLHR